MPVKKIGEPRVVGTDNQVTAMVKWVLAKIKKDEAEAEQKRIRPRLVELFEDLEPDSEGHRYLELPEPIEGYKALQYQRRVSQKPDLDKVIEVLEQYGLLDQCTTTVRVPDEEAIMQAVYAGKLPEEELASMFPQTETFAVVVKRG